MIFRVDELKDTCNIILSAVDTSGSSVINELLELKVENNIFVMCVTNKEYYVEVKICPSDADINFHATVNASIFLKLISKITTDTIELKTEDNTLVIVGNGTYKLPIIYDGESVLSLPKIIINNVTINFPIDGDILFSINKYNTKQLSIGYMNKPVQKYYYVDEQGAITYTTGACVNKFSLSTPVKMLLKQKLVKLFSLFKNTTVNFSLGYDPISENMVQTKVKFEIDNICITSSIAINDSLITDVPAQAIRDRAFETYTNSIVFNKNEFVQAIDRLMLFNGLESIKCSFIFSSDSVQIYDSKNGNSEKVYYNNDLKIEEPYSCKMYLQDIKSVLDCFADQHLTMNFGDRAAIVVSNGIIYNVIPEADD